MQVYVRPQGYITPKMGLPETVNFVLATITFHSIKNTHVIDKQGTLLN